MGTKTKCGQPTRTAQARQRKVQNLLERKKESRDRDLLRALQREVKRKFTTLMNELEEVRDALGEAHTSTQDLCDDLKVFQDLIKEDE